MYYWWYVTGDLYTLTIKRKQLSYETMNVHKLAGEKCIWAMVNPMSALACSIYSDTASAEVRAFILHVLHWVVQCCFQGSELVFIQDVAPTPTVNQSCQCRAIQGLCMAMRYRVRLGLCITPSIWSPRPHFWIKHKLAFSLGLCNGLVHWDGLKKLLD